MLDNEASYEEWQKLLETTVRFKQLGCWEWMTNDDYFIITDPETEETGCCLVLGNGGEEFGLNVYLGAKAPVYLQVFQDPFDGLLGEDPGEFALSMRGITVNFENRDQLDKGDLALIKEHGFKFRGSQAWPQYRSYEPGFAPWALNGQQVRILTTALEQTIHVGERLREDHSLFLDGQQGDGSGLKRLHRIPQTTTGNIEWRDEWLPWTIEGALLEPYVYPDELRLRQLKRSLKKSGDVWESDYRFLPMGISEQGERPIYPRLFLWVNQEDGQIIACKIEPLADSRQQYVEQLIELMEAAGVKPALLEVGSDKAYLALKDSAERMGVPLRYNSELEALLEAMTAIENGF